MFNKGSNLLVYPQPLIKVTLVFLTDCETVLLYSQTVKLITVFPERASEPRLLRVLPPDRDVFGVLEPHPLRMVQRGIQRGVPRHRKVRWTVLA